MDELAAATPLESMATSDSGELATANGEPGVNLSDASVQKVADSAFSVDKENQGDQRGGSEARSGAPRAMDVDLPPRNQPSRVDTHSLLVHNISPGNQAVSTASQLTAASVLKRTAELFPGGTTAPATKPRQPPIVEKPTSELASLAFAASKDVQLTRGKLAREEAAAFITADFLGIELLHEEALKLGESVRRAAQSVEDRVMAKEKAAAAKRSRLRSAAAKDAGRTARLDTELQQLETETAAACEEIRRKEIKLNGLPDRRSTIVEARAPSVPALPTQPEAELPAQRPAQPLQPPPQPPLPPPPPIARKQLKRLFGSREAAEAIYSCREIELAQDSMARTLAWPTHPCYDEFLEDNRRHLAEAKCDYAAALCTLKENFPTMVCCEAFEAGGCSHGKPCECGSTQAPWPWIVKGACGAFCECHMEPEVRRAWMKPAGVRYWE